LGVGGKQLKPCILRLEEFRQTFRQIIKFQQPVQMLSLRIILTGAPPRQRLGAMIPDVPVELRVLDAYAGSTDIFDYDGRPTVNWFVV